MLTHEMRLALFQQQSVWLRHVPGFHYDLIFDDVMHDNNLGFAEKKSPGGQVHSASFVDRMALEPLWTLACQLGQQ